MSKRPIQMSNSIEKILIHRDIKPTAMRILVLKHLLEKQAVTSLTDLESFFENTDKSTLFRTLKKFSEKKLIHKIDDGTGIIKYGLCEENCNCEPEDQHVHFHCTRCEDTYCLNYIKIPDLKIPEGFEGQSVNMVISGICSNCN